MRVSLPIITHNKPIFFGLVTSLLILILTQLIAYQRYLIEQDIEYKEIHREVQSVKDRIEASLSYSHSATKILAFIIKEYGVPKNFEHIAKGILDTNQNIDALELTREGVITHVFPLQGNEPAIGYDILSDSLRAGEAIRAIEKKEHSFAGPFELKQGEMAIVGRLPIYDNDKFWGFSASLIKLSTLLTAAGIETDPENRYTYQLSKYNATTGKEDFFLPLSDQKNKNQVASLQVSGGDWKIYVALKEKNSSFFIVILSVLSTIFSITAGLFTYNLMKRPDELRKLVDEKSGQLLATQHNYQSTLERVTDGFIAYDKNWCYTYINSSAAEVLDLDPSRLIGKNIWTEFPELAEQPIYRAYKVAIEQQRNVSIESYFTAKGKWFENHIYPSPEGLSVFFRDISESKIAKEKLKANESYFRALIENSSNALALLDDRGKVTYQTPSASRIAGYSLTEIQSIDGLELIHPDDRERASASFQWVLQSPGETVHWSHRLKCKNGGYIWIEGSHTNLLYDENVKAIVTNYNNVTDRVIAEEKMKKASRFYYLISQINKMIIHVKDEETLFQNACKIAVESGKFKMGWVGLFEEPERKVIPVAHAGDEFAYLSTFHFIPIDDESKGRGPTGSAFSTAQTIVCNDIENDPRMRPWVNEAMERGYRSSIALPIKRLEKVVGVFTLYSSVPHYFDSEEIALLEEVAGDISFTLDNFEKEKMRQQAEYDAYNAHKEKETTLNRISDSVVSLDLEWRYTFLNEIALATHPVGRKEALGKTIWDVHPELTGTVFEDQYRQAMNTKKPAEITTYYLPMDKWFTVKIYPSDDGLTIFYQDVSQQKNSEKEIASEKIFTETILGSLPGIFYLYDREGKFLRWNKNFETISAYGAAEITNMHLVDFFPDEEKSLITEKFNDVFIWGSAHLEAHFYTKRGEKIPYYFTGCKLNYKGAEYLMGMGFDISERVDAEKAEAEIQKRLKAIFSGTSDTILLADNSGKYVQVNPAATKMLGYTEEELLNKTSDEIVSSTNKPGLWSAFIEEGHQIGTIELKKKNGEIIVCHYNATVNILPGLHLSILTDITERMQASEKLRQSEARLIEAQRVAKVGSWETELSDMRVTWSAETYRIFEIDPSDFTGSHPDFLMYVHPDDRSKVDAAFLKSLDQSTYFVISHRIITPGGVTKYVEERWQTFLDDQGVPVRVLGTCQDITERKKAEDALQESETKYRMLFANNPMPMWVLDRDGVQFLDVNEAAITHYGYSRYEFLSMTTMDIRPKEEQIRFAQFLEQDPSGLNHTGTWKHVKKDGSIIDVEIVVHDFNVDQINRRLILANDITDKLKSDKEIKESYQKMQELTAYLQHVREDERTRIAREIHDELGQQLTGLKMDTSWVYKKIDSRDTPVHQKLQMMMSLIDETVKTVRRISSDLRPGILDDLGLMAAIEWHGQEFEKRTGIKSVLHTDLAEFSADRNSATHIFRIYQEALTNIARHAQATEIETLIEEGSGYVTLTIKDNGIGFDMVEAKTKKSWGLVGMKERALLFHGKLTIESKKGTGTSIRLKTPVGDQEKVPFTQLPMKE